MKKQEARRKGVVVPLLLVTCSALLLLLLRESFAGRFVIDPIAFSLGSLEVRWYGLLAALGLALGIPWALRRARQLGMGPDDIVERIYWIAVLGGLVGARLLYIAQNWQEYFSQPHLIIDIRDGGLSIHGMILGGFVAGALAARFWRLSFWMLADAAVPPMLLGMIIGRFGNFANHELVGYPTDRPWKMFVPQMDRPIGYEQLSFFHPIFLYDALLNSALLLVLLAAYPRSAAQAGQLTLQFLLGLSVTRFLVEFWRLNDPPSTGLSTAQIASLVIGSAAAALLLLRRPAR